MNKRHRKSRKRRMLTTGQRYYAWYSEKMEACLFLGKPFGNCIYKRPDGKLVKTTIISKSRNHGTRWDDVKYLGKVIGPLFGGLITINKPKPDFIVPPDSDSDRRMAMYFSYLVKPNFGPFLIVAS